MCAGRATGRSNPADDVAAIHVLARLRHERAEMPVARRETERMLDHHEVAIVARVRRRFDDAVGRREHWIAFLGRDVESLVEAWFARERIRTSAERASQPAVCRPDGWR